MLEFACYALSNLLKFYQRKLKNKEMTLTTKYQWSNMDSNQEMIHLNKQEWYDL